MTSFRQFEANRRNAQRSTGPKTAEGKRRSRLNAIRHGLTAETVVANLEDVEDYKAFEATIIADYCAETAVARELVLRLASLLWRLRRATAIETNLFRNSEIGDDCSVEQGLFTNRSSDDAVQNRFPRFQPEIVALNTSGNSEPENSPANGLRTDSSEFCYGEPTGKPTKIADAFLRLASLDSGAFERLNRYEAALWRQAVQIIWTLKPIRAR